MLRALPSALVTLALLAGCDRADPGCYDRSDAHVRIATTSSELAPPMDGETVTGTFTQWGPGEVVFEGDDGGLTGFALELEAFAPLPDLGVLAIGPVSLTGWGFESRADRPTEPTIHVRGPEGDTLLLLGTGEWSADGWTVEAPRNMNACTAYEHDMGQARNKPAFITLGDATARMLQGDVTTLGGLQVRMLSAQSNNRAHPWAPCSTADCPWEKLSWMAVDPELSFIAPPPG